MKKAIKKISLALTALLALTAVGCNEGEKGTTVGEGQYVLSQTRMPEPVHKYTYNLLGEDEMPVMMFSGPISEYVYNGVMMPSLMTDEVFADVQECGVNTVLGVENGVEKDFTDIIRTLDLADKYNLNYVVFDPILVNTKGEANTLADPTSAEFGARKAMYEKYKSFAGLHLVDEPSIKYNAKIKTHKEYVLEHFGEDKIPYVNMLPEDPNLALYSGVKGDGSVTYEQLIDSFLKDTGMPYLSYDRYPFHKNHETVIPGWFNNLAIIRHYAEKYDVPFMGCVQVGGEWEGIGNKLPNENEFMWNVNTMLAYGCKGICYFPGVHSTYHIENPNGNEGLIALDGKRTQYWYYANALDDQITATEKVLMNAANLGIMVSGEVPDAINDKYVTIFESFRELKSVTGTALVGCFDYKGKTALYVVNNSLKGEGEIELNFDDNYGYDVVQQAVFRTTKGMKLTLKLAAGESALITLR